jgi:hypothetical protein
MSYASSRTKIKVESTATTLDPTMAAKEPRAEQVITMEVNDDGEDEFVDPAGDGEQDEPQEPEIKLYKSTRIKGYITLIVASVINFDSAQKSKDVKATNAVASTIDQRRYAISVALVSLILSTAVLLMHLDRITMFKNAWTKAFQPKSKIELGLALFQVIWWSVAVGVETSVQGIAGDGKGQYSLYYSSWACCLTSYWILERWWVAAGWSSLKSFITSWPYRAPGWILILFLSIFTLVWYVDLWQNHGGEGSRVEIVFNNVPEGQWQWLVIIATFTVIPAVVFVLVELFRETKAGKFCRAVHLVPSNDALTSSSIVHTFRRQQPREGTDREHSRGLLTTDSSHVVDSDDNACYNSWRSS